MLFTTPIPKPDGNYKTYDHAERWCISCVNFVSGEILENPNRHELLTENPNGEITGINVTRGADDETECDATRHKSA